VDPESLEIMRRNFGSKFKSRNNGRWKDLYPCRLPDCVKPAKIVLESARVALRPCPSLVLIESPSRDPLWQVLLQKEKRNQGPPIPNPDLQADNTILYGMRLRSEPPRSVSPSSFALRRVITL
jgi:hypothetical protein